MNTPESNSARERRDQATARRLAKLRALPVDTSALAKAVEAQVPRPAQKQRRPAFLWIRPMRAVAASVLVVGLIAALIISSSGGPVLASAERMAQIHQDVFSGASHPTQVDSIGAANAILASKWPGAPALPEPPKDHVMSCCVHEVGRKKMACVSFQADGVLVSMAVADATEVRMPATETMTVAGVKYHVQSHEGINMVMTERNGRWVCLMGKLPTNRLVELASALRF
jgi:hypothetical protein